MSRDERAAEARRRLVFALDVPTVREAMALVRELRGEVGIFKIGKQLFVHAGPEVVRLTRRAGADVFLDLKFHDIPRTVAAAAVEAARLGVTMLDVHAAAGAEAMRRARREVARACRREGLARPALLAVTVLTSLARADLRAIGVAGPVATQVVRLARLARASAMDGVVASPQEIAAIRSACGPRFLIVTPGVRPAGAARDDQRRVLTPAEAIARGADSLVVGKPIRDAASPRAAARALVAEIMQALDDRRGAARGRGPTRARGGRAGAGAR